MAVPKSVLWERDPHTAAKHTLLRRYMSAWFPIMAKQYQGDGITFLDGFAGPGEYLNSDESSPVIACSQAVRSEVVTFGANMRLVFIEVDAERAAHLEQLLDRRFPPSRRPGNLSVTVVRGECDKLYDSTLQRVGGWAGPVFANLDGWGADTPYTLVQRIASQQSSEVLVTLKEHHFIQFWNNVGNGDRIFGCSDWRQVSSMPTPEKRPFLLDLYRRQLHAAGFDYVLTFEMVDEGGHSLYQFFGTTNTRAVEKFKDGLWEVDEVSGQRFRDPRDINQLAFDMRQPDFTGLEREIVRVITEQGSVDLRSLCDHALLETIYKISHVKPVVERLESRGVIERRTNGRAFAEKRYVLATPTLF